MEWKEKVGLVALFLALLSWGIEIFDNWPLLVAHLNPANWIMIVLIHLVVVFSLISVYAKAPKGTPLRWEILLATAFVIISWSMNLYLTGKIAG